MPRKLCFATLLVSSLLTGNGFAQQYLSQNFGTRIATELSSESVTPVPGGTSHHKTLSTPSEGSAQLVQPAVHRSPDRYVRPVQQASHSELSADMPAEQERVANPESNGARELASEPQTDTDAGSEHDFPVLPPPGDSRHGASGTVPSPQGLGSVVTVISSLAVVLGLFFITAWLMRRTGSGGASTLPNDVFELLGRAHLSNRQQVHLIRCGTKLLLVSVTPDGAETLTEIDDPDEATRLAGLCKANQAGSASAAFQQVLQQFAGQPAEPGFVGRNDSRTTRAKRSSELENLHG